MTRQSLSALVVVVFACVGCGTNEPTNTGSLRAYAAWGDSLTAGHQGQIDLGDYPQDLQQSLGAPSIVENEGVSGQTSVQIGVREGALQTTVTVIGGTVPASGPVAVSFPATSVPVTDVYDPVGGTIAGVHGVVSMQSSGGLIFTRTADGDPVSVATAAPFAVDTLFTGGGFVPIFWEGRNDSWSNPQAIVDNISKQVAFAGSQSYLVMSVINGNYGPAESKGGGSYNAILAVNQALASAFGAHYLDIRSLLVSHYDPTNAIDVADFNNDQPPTSLHAIFANGTLAQDIDASATTFKVSLSQGILVAGAKLNIGGTESALITSLAEDGVTFTVQRGFTGAAVAHAAGSAITVTDPIHLNATGYQIVADAVYQWFGK